MTNNSKETGAVTIDPADIKRIVRKYDEQLYTHKFYELYEMD